MSERAVPGRGRLHAPTLGQWVGLLVAEGFVWLIGAVIAGYTEWSPLRWVIAAVMVLVLVRWLLKLRSPRESQWGGGGDGGYPTTVTSYDGMSGSGAA